MSPLYVAILTAMLQWGQPRQNDVRRLTEYTRIADAIVHATEDRDEAFLLASVASYESGYVINAVGRLPAKDGGPEWGAWQLSYWHRSDVRAQAKEALRRIRYSLATCGDLAHYTSGSCYRGHEASAKRLARAAQWMGAD